MGMHICKGALTLVWRIPIECDDVVLYQFTFILSCCQVYCGCGFQGIVGIVITFCAGSGV